MIDDVNQPMIFPKQAINDSRIFYPESTVELDSLLLRSDNKNVFKNKKIGKLLSDDLVRSYLDDYEIKALYHLASAYEGLVDASNGKFEGVFDNASEMVLADISFIVNIARSREGVNILTIKGRQPIKRFERKNDYFEKFKTFPERNGQQQENDYYRSVEDYQKGYKV